MTQEMVVVEQEIAPEESLPEKTPVFFDFVKLFLGVVVLFFGFSLYAKSYEKRISKPTRLEKSLTRQISKSSRLRAHSHLPFFVFGSVLGFMFFVIFIMLCVLLSQHS